MGAVDPDRGRCRQSGLRAKARELVREQLGELHILVNNAAILDMTGIDALTLDRFEHVLRINLTGAVFAPWRCCRS